jgi:hypothetical protein
MEIEDGADVRWVAALSGRDERAAHSALLEAGSDRRLFSHIARLHRVERRPDYGEIVAPLELYALVRLMRPQHVVEVGVSSGVSSAYLLRALEANRYGTLHSVDLPKPPRRTADGSVSVRSSWSLPPGRSSGWAVPFVLRPRWDLRLGNKSIVLPLLASELPRVDLFVYDVPHDDADARREFRELEPLIPDGGVAIADHGPGGGCCAALAAVARSWKAPAVGRRGSGLYGARRAAR